MLFKNYYTLIGETSTNKDIDQPYLRKYGWVTPNQQYYVDGLSPKLITERKSITTPLVIFFFYCNKSL